jgi:hypothetical protein
MSRVDLGMLVICLLIVVVILAVGLRHEAYDVLIVYTPIDGKINTYTVYERGSEAYISTDVEILTKKALGWKNLGKYTIKLPQTDSVDSSLAKRCVKFYDSINLVMHTKDEMDAIKFAILFTACM